MVSISRTKWLRILMFGLIVLALLVLNGCGPLFPLKTPYDYPDSTWESTEPYIYLHVADRDPYNAEIYTLVNGEKVELLYMCDEKTSAAEFLDPNSREYTRFGSGLTKCYLLFEHKVDSKKIVIRIREDNLFNDEYKSIILYRIE